MFITILLYILFIALMLCLPKSIWDQIYLFFKNFKLICKSYWSLGHKKNSSILLMQLSDIDAHLMLRGGYKKEIREYKFFDQLIYSLLETNRQFGTNIRGHLKEIKKNLTSDIAFEKKLSSLVNVAYFQILAIAFTTWIFIQVATTMIDVPLKIKDAMIIFAIQIFSFFLFRFVLLSLKKVSFIKFNSVFSALYTFKLYSEIGVSVTYALESSKLLTGEMAKHVAFKESYERSTLAVERWQTQGVSPSEEIGEVLAQMWELLEAEFIRFEKRMNLVKFLVLVFFMLPSYFYFLFGLFNHFLSQ